MKLDQANAMTLQEQLDYAVNKIVEQGKRCMPTHSGSGLCAYGNDEDEHCAIGWLLDENNGELMGYRGSVSMLIYSFDDDVPYNMKTDTEIFATFQNFHDNQFSNDRCFMKNALHNKGIDVYSNENWQRWIDMGEGEES